MAVSRRVPTVLPPRQMLIRLHSVGRMYGIIEGLKMIKVTPSFLRDLTSAKSEPF